MHINLKPISKPSNFFAISLILSSIALSQSVPVGLSEGLMGNSGVAISESSASGYYNPSLMLFKNKSSMSISGNTFSNYSDTTENSKLTSSKISPSYLSSLQIFDSYVHEFFLANVTSLDAQVLTKPTSGGEQQLNLRSENYLMGYTFGFRELPVGFQTAFRFAESQAQGFFESQEVTKSVTSQLQGSSRQLDFLISIGGTHQFDGYRFGYKYSSRGLNIYKKKEGVTKTHTYISALNSYAKTESAYDVSQNLTGEVIVIGHGFKINDHEFLTDTKLEEGSDLTYAYNWNQSFGYRLNSAAGYQYMCGVSHLINKDIKYFGQSMYVSTGFSWLTRSYRSAIGVYYNVDKLRYDTRNYGLTFSSEFIY